MTEVGQIVSQLEEKLFGESVDIRPPKGEEWFISNIYHSRQAALYKVEGEKNVQIASDNDPKGGAWANFKYFVTNTSYLRVTNASTPPNQDVEVKTISILGYEGVRIR